MLHLSNDSRHLHGSHEVVYCQFNVLHIIIKCLFHLEYVCVTRFQCIQNELEL